MKSYVIQFESDALLSEVEIALQMLNPANLKMSVGLTGPLTETKISELPVHPGVIRPRTKTQLSTKGSVNVKNRDGLPTLKEVLGRKAELNCAIPTAMAEHFPLNIFHDGLVCIKKQDRHGNHRYVVDFEMSCELLGRTETEILSTNWTANSAEVRLKGALARVKGREDRKALNSQETSAD